MNEWYINSLMTMDIQFGTQKSNTGRNVSIISGYMNLGTKIY